MQKGLTGKTEKGQWFMAGMIVVILITLTVFSINVAAFTGPSQDPPLGDKTFWRVNGTSIYFDSDNVGIGTSNPSYGVSVSGGDIYASGSVRGGTGLCIAGSCRTSIPTSVPSGMVLFFNLSSCPTGWSELTGARGRYLVGKPSGGTLAGTAGTALSNLENRAAGQHTHTVDDPGHSHYVFHNPGIGLAGLDYDAGTNFDFDNPVGTDSSYTEISVDNAGNVAGSNAPYMQLLVCQKS